MDQRTISIYLSRILSGFYIFTSGNQKYKLVYPDISIKYEAELFADQVYEENKFNDWIKEEDIIYALIDMGVWSHNGDDSLKNIEKQIEDYKVELFNSYLNPTKLKTLRKTLLNIKNQHNRLYEIRHSLDHLTVEGYSQALKNQYILINSLFTSTNERLYNSVEEADFNRLNAISSVITNNTIDINTYRKIARSDIWKNYWSANNDQLFDKATINWTDEQKTLVVITKMYDSAYQHPECPPDQVIEDDDMFDGWMIHQKRENEKIKNKNRTEKLLEGKKLNKAGEIFVKAESQEEAQNIYDLNDNTSRHIIKERYQAINRASGQISDAVLPDNQRNLVVQSNQQFVMSARKQ
jgi:hypothetical protein